jgi:apolipoprotein N-acyltransferase
MEYIALVVGLIGILMAWSAGRKNKELNERIAQTNSRIYNLRRELDERQEQAQHELTALKVEVLRLKGELAITPETRIGELPLMHPQALQVLAGFHLGGCSSCSVDERQTLGEAAAVNGREIEPILVALNTLVAEGNNGNGQVASERLKMPNIQLHF